MNPKDAGFSTKSVHSGEKLCPLTGSITTPIYQTSNFGFTDLDSLKRVFADHSKGYFYTRYSNPTLEAVEGKLANLMGAQKALVFSSGMAALTTAVMSLVSSGDHIVSAFDIYGGTFNFFSNVLPRYGVTVDLLQTTEAGKLAESIKPNTRIIFFESPTNPLLKLMDINEVAKIGKERGIVTFMDNTFATPFNQKPIGMGIDLVMHSATKYLGGHSDLIGGVVGGDEELIRKVMLFRYVFGGIPDPQSAWLLMRGVKTLKVRMEAHNQNGMKVARFLENHSRVDRVYYPGLESHPQQGLAKRQMKGFGGMVSFEVAGDNDALGQFLRRLRICQLAVSLGGIESLICPPALTTHRRLSKSQRSKAGIKDNLVRLSVGIEDAEDLIDDLAQALGATS
ncbi:MAG: aminotransferase class I/II-fold pyridoxal phosphate-dependent enzyme [Proteobacteria bacterium]|nr:aminotransferase class I/II-fold pyridoxal phosphate-dependent enzyme [Pseudomonadota bacterium]